jgi:glucose-1-phosphate thymidylyltransferase
MSFSYAEQPKPEGLAQAFLIGREFLAGSPACLVLGDNIFYGHGFTGLLRDAAKLTSGARVFGYWVKEPQQYGVVEFDDDGRAIGLEEKPAKPRSHFAVPGLYYYGPDVCDVAATLKPSARGELEITALNNAYLARGELAVTRIGRGVAWLDTGSHRSLLEASNFIQTIEDRQGLKVACIEEIAWRAKWIDDAQLTRIAESLGKSLYGNYLRDLASGLLNDRIG